MHYRLKSKTSDVWVERRVNFTKTTAVMSVVGYLLGLGDRHLANIMLERKSGKIVHIDFGDCFESTLNRPLFPEKVPFRLTRMLTNAMEASGIEGTFKLTCEKVMGVLRENRDSLEAMLEVFLDDPLVSWEGKKRVVTGELATELVLEEDVATDGDGEVGEVPGARPKAEEAIAPIIKPKTEEDAAEVKKPKPGEAQVVGINSRALEYFSRIQAKLTGRDFVKSVDRLERQLTVEEQVDKLIRQATSAENLCLHYSGWKPFW